MVQCDRCDKKVGITIDLWVQGFSHSIEAGVDIGDSKAFELDRIAMEAPDYVIVCEECWKEALPAYRAFVANWLRPKKLPTSCG